MSHVTYQWVTWGKEGRTQERCWMTWSVRRSTFNPPSPFQQHSSTNRPWSTKTLSLFLFHIFNINANLLSACTKLIYASLLGERGKIDGLNLQMDCGYPCVKGCCRVLITVLQDVVMCWFDRIESIDGLWATVVSVWVFVSVSLFWFNSLRSPEWSGSWKQLNTVWPRRRLCLELRVSFHKTAINSRTVLLKIAYIDQATCVSPPCRRCISEDMGQHSTCMSRSDGSSTAGNPRAGYAGLQMLR